MTRLKTDEYQRILEKSLTHKMTRRQREWFTIALLAIFTAALLVTLWLKEGS